jgi:hypothetical protein
MVLFGYMLQKVWKYENKHYGGGGHQFLDQFKFDASLQLYKVCLIKHFMFFFLNHFAISCMVVKVMEE